MSSNHNVLSRIFEFPINVLKWFFFGILDYILLILDGIKYFFLGIYDLLALFNVKIMYKIIKKISRIFSNINAK